MTRHDSIKLRHKRLRKKVSGTTERPRLAVSFSGRHIRAQVIDDTKGVTLAAASTQEKAAKAGANVVNATSVGKLVADRAKQKSISKVVFDRGGFQYMGKVKALADAAREAGLEF
ncbi:MAG: 50S ribosomal protein L18 [Verrucomicrobia bacterium]|jgi:large subunit ribosomal protein L18|nr:50S ribosomal protein L18 [Verrucomicrobiota bacterium]MDA1204501.1 50S ribosomal protein L18 [Verrucomicrobiota bacterium]